jgi:TonB family protein
MPFSVSNQCSRIWVLAAAFLPLQVAHASPPPANSPSDAAIPMRTVATVAGWTIRDGNGACLSVASYEHNRILTLVYDFGRNSAWLGVIDPAWRSIRANASYQVGVRFSNGESYGTGPAAGVRYQDGAAPGILMRFSSDEFLQSFAAATSISLTMGETRLGSFSLSGTRAMVERLIRCAAASYRANPRDPFAAITPAPSPGEEGDRHPPAIRPIPPRLGEFETVSPRGPQAARPQRSLGSYFTADDYPFEARRRRAWGTVQFRLGIDTSGHVSDCTVTSTSGSAELDLATCRILRLRARYFPARNSEGSPVADVASGQLTWTNPAQ